MILLSLNTGSNFTTLSIPGENSVNEDEDINLLLDFSSLPGSATLENPQENCNSALKNASFSKGKVSARKKMVILNLSV